MSWEETKPVSTHVKNNFLFFITSSSSLYSTLLSYSSANTGSLTGGWTVDVSVSQQV